MYLTSSYWNIALLVFVGAIDICCVTHLFVLWMKVGEIAKSLQWICASAAVFVIIAYLLFGYMVVCDIVESEEREHQRQIAARYRQRQQPVEVIYEAIPDFDWDADYDPEADNQEFLDKEATDTKGKTIVFDMEGGFRWE